MWDGWLEDPRWRSCEMTYEECLEDIKDFSKELGYKYHEIQLEALDMFVAIKSAKIKAEYDFDLGAGTKLRRLETTKEAA